MDTSQHVSKQTNKANHPVGMKSMDSLITLTLGLEGVRHCRKHCAKPVGGSREKRKLSPAEEEKDYGRMRVDEKQEGKVCKQKVLGVLTELNVFHSDRLIAWKEAIIECASMLKKAPPEGSVEQHPATSENKTWTCSDSLSDIFLSVGEDIDNLVDKLVKIITKLNAAVLQLSANEALTSIAVLQESRDTDTLVQCENFRSDQLEYNLGYEPKVEDDQSQKRLPNTEQTLDSDCNNMEKIEEKLQDMCQVNDFLEKPLHCQTNLEEKTQKDNEKINIKKKEEETCEWISVGLGGQSDESRSEAQDQSFIRASAGAAKVLWCEVADHLSCLMVSSSEELVSRVIHIKVQAKASLHFPLTVAMPFRVRHRGSYRDVAVKIVDEERRVSYITPVTIEDVYRGQKGSFAEVKVYSLGLFAVVSCLKRENYTIPKRGLSLKLPMDSRICLNYLPGSFTAPVMAQTMVQPVDAVLLAAVKSRNEAYKAVVSASPLLFLTHPTSQPLKRPLTVTLPCPPNPDKKRDKRGQDKPDHQCRPVCAPLRPSERVRILDATMKSKETSNESLIVLGSRDKQWSVLDQVSARSQQNGLVSFDLREIYDRLLVVRLLSPLQPCQLASLAEDLEESTRIHAVTVLLQRRREDPNTILVAVLPSKDLSWELSKLQTQGYDGLMETSAEILMCEADQLLLCFTGNISSIAFAQNCKSKADRLTFHSQRRNHLLVRLTEVDPFGNYSSPHYKGTALFYRVGRDQLEWQEDKTVLKDPKLLGDPVCKLSLTLPKKVRNINRPTAARVKLCEETDSLPDALLLWLSGELSQEEIALLMSSLRLRRSAAQLVKLRAGDSPSAQAFHVLTMWRRALPAVPHQSKASQLAQCLAKSGRPDLAGELLLRQAELAEIRKLKK
ncbi:death domain-containing protein 1 [Melanotaenia boesemani]|uniref:death domain-containing protein 1 n=1 Tax=Melanotaenia boesemani TaxID=1250792 RepID=UPI001C045D2C|nr:death domain-containing protein 1 [Melanotaenia boesemani]